VARREVGMVDAEDVPLMPAPRMLRRPLRESERDVQKSVVGAYEAVGCIVANFSQGYRPGGRRHGTTRQTKGIPDLYVFPPLSVTYARHGSRDGRPWWHEVKHPGGDQSPEQVTWQRRCEDRAVGYVLGGVDEALAYLWRIGLVEEVVTPSGQRMP
jgi:hypothetical protein